MSVLTKLFRKKKTPETPSDASPPSSSSQTQRVIRHSKSRSRSIGPNQMPSFLRTRAQSHQTLPNDDSVVGTTAAAEATGTGSTASTPFHGPLQFRRNTRSTVRLIKNLPKLFPIFGRRLEQCNPKTLSPFLFHSVGFMSENLGLGVFRVAASQLLFNDLLRKVESGYPYNPRLLVQLNEPNVVADVLKHFLRESPRPLLASLYDRVQDSSFEVDPPSIMEIVPILQSNLEEYELIVLIEVFSLLYKACYDCFEETNMNSEAMSIVFTPNVYTKDLLSFASNQEIYQRGLKLTEKLIDLYEMWSACLLPEGHPYLVAEERLDKMAAFSQLIADKRATM